MDESEFYERTFSTLIITNNTEYLDQCVKSSINPLVVFDGIAIPIDFHYDSVVCNASRPSVARNFGLEKIDNCEFVQLLDSDDFLNENYFETLLSIISQNNDYDIFYTDYDILNEDFKFTNREYLKSIGDRYLLDNLFKIKNPLIRKSAFKNKKFDVNLTNFELVDFMLQVGIDKVYHIPKNLQTVRIHSKCYNRLSSKQNQKQSSDIINGRINGKI